MITPCQDVYKSIAPILIVSKNIAPRLGNSIAPRLIINIMSSQDITTAPRVGINIVPRSNLIVSIKIT